MSHHLVRSHTLTKSSLKTVAAAVVLSALAATPVFAQAAIQEPGAFAFYHPYLDVLNGGAPTPAASDISHTSTNTIRYRTAMTSPFLDSDVGWANPALATAS